MLIDLNDITKRENLSDLANKVLDEPKISKMVSEINNLFENIEKKENELKAQEEINKEFDSITNFYGFLAGISFIGALVSGGIFLEYRSGVYNMDYYPHVTVFMIISCLTMIIVSRKLHHIAVESGSINSPKKIADIEKAKNKITSKWAFFSSKIVETEAKVLGMVYHSRCWNTYYSLKYGCELIGAERIFALGLGQSTNTRIPSEKLQDSQGHRYDEPFIDGIGRRWKSVWHKIEVLSLKAEMTIMDKEDEKSDHTTNDFSNTTQIAGMLYGDNYENRGYQEHEKLVEQYGPEYIELGEWSCERAYNEYVETGHDIYEEGSPDFNDWKLKYGEIDFVFYSQEHNKKKARKKPIPKKKAKKNILTVECPECTSKIKVRKISNTQPIKCSNCGLEGEIEL